MGEKQTSSGPHLVAVYADQYHSTCWGNNWWYIAIHLTLTHGPLAPVCKVITGFYRWIPIEETLPVDFGGQNDSTTR